MTRKNEVVEILSQTEGEPCEQEIDDKIARDTTIVYDIYNISTEGAGATAKYRDGKIHECQLDIYGETGKSEINYIFMDDSIKVTDKTFRYKTYFTEVKSDEDIKLEKVSVYTLDYEGNLLNGADHEGSDVFLELKREVPFSLD